MFQYVEYTLDFRLSGHHTLRLWINAKGEIPKSFEVTEAIERALRELLELGHSFEEIVEYCKRDIPDLNTVQLIRGGSQPGVADHGFVCYTVSFEDVHG